MPRNMLLAMASVGLVALGTGALNGQEPGKRTLNDAPSLKDSLKRFFAESGNAKSAGSATTMTQEKTGFFSRLKQRFTSKSYSQSGKYQGRSVTNGKTTKFFGRSGKYSGKSVSNGKSTKHYGRDGKYGGKSISSGKTTKHYARDGKYRGKSVTSGKTTKTYDRSGKYRGKTTRSK